MRHHKDRGAELVDLLQQQHQLQTAHRVEVPGRLVGNDHARIVHERAGDRHALLLTAGELRRIAFFPVDKADQLEHLRHAAADLLIGRSDHTHGKRNVFIHRHFVDQAKILKNDAQSPAQLRQLAALDALHVKAVDRDLSGCGTQLAGDQLDDRRLAGARRSDQKHEFPFVDREADATERLGFRVSVDHPHIVHLNHKMSSNMLGLRPPGCELRTWRCSENRGISLP